MFTYEPSYQVKHSKILCYLDFLPFSLHKVTTSSKLCCCIVVWSNWQNVSGIELGSSSCELPAAKSAERSGAIEVSVNRVIKRYNQCIPLFIYLFFFLMKEKGRLRRGSDHGWRKTKIVQNLGHELCRKIYRPLTNSGSDRTPDRTGIFAFWRLKIIIFISL